MAASLSAPLAFFSASKLLQLSNSLENSQPSSYVLWINATFKKKKEKKNIVVVPTSVET